MSLYRVQDQPAVTSREATRPWCVLVGASPEGGESSTQSRISKKFAHRGPSFGLCAGLVVRLGNPEDRP
jgi:hypothetical protein